MLHTLDSTIVRQVETCLIVPSKFRRLSPGALTLSTLRLLSPRTLFSYGTLVTL